ncbi:MAG: ABC transporter ATP-binding protein/permease [Bacteroidales bacterium]|nr:ABC transporter ATP-binding protein/permease [Bacteroidales bacterium]
MKKYWQILRKYWWSLILCPLLVLVFVVCETLQPMLMARIVDDGVMLKDIDIITRVGLYMVGISLLGLAANITNVYISSNTSVGFATDLRTLLFNKIQTLSFAEIDKFNSASLITRLTNDITRIQQVVLLGLRIMFRSPMMLIMAFVYVLRINSGLAIIVAASIPILGIAVYFILKKGFPYFLRMQKKVDSLNAVVRENLINIRVVKSFVRERYESRKFSASNKDLQDVSIRAANIIVTIFPVMQLVLNLSVIVVLWAGGTQVASGNLKVGELVSLVNYLMQILMSLMMMSMIIMNIARASASSDRILEVLDTESSLKDSPKSVTDNNKITQGSVSFKNVNFRYAGAGTDVLYNINFDVSQGQTIAIVGATGSGKSTLLQLIPRLYDASDGSVWVDGHDVRNYLLDELHHKVGMVLQKNVLFSGTIEENIRWGKKDATIEEIMEATKAAQAHDFIMSFPNGYSTVLGRGGVNVSGGQKQRICIARSLIARPKILILDDSTSAVDTDTEKKMRSGLKEYLGDTTVFIATQRVKTMEGADKVLVLDDGTIESFDTPEKLHEQSRIYREIVYSQQMAF